MSDLSGSTTPDGTLSDLTPVSTSNDGTLVVEPSTGTGMSPISAAIRQKYSSRVLNILLPRKETHDTPRTIRPPLVRRIEDHPRGYPGLTAFEDSNDFFKIYRKFSFLRGRLLLDKEIELAQLEEKLHAIDKEDSELRVTSVMSRNATEGRTSKTAQRFRDLMDEINEKLVAYEQLVLRAKAFRELKAPHPNDLESVHKYIESEMPFIFGEIDYLERGDDFMSLADGAEIGWFDSAVSLVLDILPRNSFLTSPEQKKLTDEKQTRLRDGGRVDAVVRAVLCATTLLFLVGPSAVRFVVSSHRFLEMVVIPAFTALFAAFLNLSTKTKRHEIIVATAIYYAAVVVVSSHATAL